MLHIFREILDTSHLMPNPNSGGGTLPGFEALPPLNFCPTRENIEKAYKQSFDFVNRKKYCSLKQKSTLSAVFLPILPSQEYVLNDLRLASESTQLLSDSTFIYLESCCNFITCFKSTDPSILFSLIYGNLTDDLKAR